MPEPYIRHAVPADEETLSRLDRIAWSPLHAVQPRPQPPYPPFFTERFGPRDHLVAELDGPGGPDPAGDATGDAGGGRGRRLVGYARLGFPTSLACNRHVRQILGFLVAEEARGAGVGRALLRAAVEEARRQGARRLTLRVLGHNAPARALYASEGFAVEGVLPEEFLLDGAYVDDVLMGRAL
ncbi:GNAT family N-acetyltransferase [Streptomyces sp. NPDC005840]|uniref:GNAT family N-acetyltransferase n=1 Tax=Streptomyces doudnae TaxID=3075536 RepID=A0ABD5EMB5_9ACTN|nr:MULTISPECIES: GNAT family N-acetyltransferase [unclassified Streptomyces]MDT0435209.1 GNAT family N-acetyltransferase [Streptomyces sp. DSM 41981]SCE33999.1 Acetyltransferase (GNAT) family protein [Streptomyces sp. SolWspMP-5a-2]